MPFIIRDEQLATLGGPALERFVEGLLPKLPAVFPDDPAVFDTPLMRERIRAAAVAAAQYRIVHPRDVALFVFLFHEYGPNFVDAASTRWMARLLTDKKLESREKMALIYARLRIAAESESTPAAPPT